MKKIELKQILEIIDEYIQNCDEQINMNRRELYSYESTPTEYFIDNARTMLLAVERREAVMWIRNEIVSELGE